MIGMILKYALYIYLTGVVFAFVIITYITAEIGSFKRYARSAVFAIIFKESLASWIFILEIIGVLKR